MEAVGAEKAAGKGKVTVNDPNAFKGVDASAVRRAAQGPAGPVRGSQDADELRRKRRARFGGGALREECGARPASAPGRRRPNKW